MKKNLFYAVLSALAFTACTNDEVVEMKQDAIEFTTSTTNVTRGEVTTANLLGFKTQAINTSTGTIFLEREVTRETGSSDWTYSPKKFWPVTNLELDFYSVAPLAFVNSIDWLCKEINFAYSGLNTTNSASTSENLDLCYAVNRAQTKEMGVVAVKFQHALSQIAFQVKNTNEDLYIKVNSISIEGIYDRGIYNIENANTAADVPVNGTWTSLSKATSSNGFCGINKGFRIVEAANGLFPNDIFVELNGEVTTPIPFVVTDEDVQRSEGFTPKSETSLFLIPQTLTPGTFAADGARNGAFLVVNCAIAQKNGTNNQDWLWCDRDSYPPYQCMPVYLPLTAPNSNTWEEGKRYVYTIIFGEGGGFTENGDDVLVPIDFTTEVKPFVDAEGQDINFTNPSNQ